MIPYCQNRILGGDNMSIDERLDFIEYRQELLFDNSDLSRLLFEYKVKRKEYRAIMDVFDEYRKKIESGERVHHGSFEQSIYEEVPAHEGNYHFVEFLAQEHHKSNRWEEVFEALYGDSPKFQSYVQK